MVDLVIEYVNSAGDRWAAWIVAASLDAAVLLALVGLVWLAIRRRVAPQVGYGLFLLVPLKLLVPVVVTVPASVARWTPSVLVSSWFEEAGYPTEPRADRRSRRGSPPPGRSIRLPSPRLEPPVADSDQPTLPGEPRPEGPIATAAVFPLAPSRRPLPCRCRPDS